MGPRAFNRVCASIRINRDYDVVSVRINAHGVTKRAWAFNCETTVCIYEYCIRVWGDTIFPTGIPFSLVNNVWRIQYSRGYRIHYDTGTKRPLVRVR